MRAKLGLTALVVAVFTAAGLWHIRTDHAQAAAPVAPAGRPPHIRPDYSGIAIPPNIAPLNFRIEEPGAAFHVTIHGASGDAIEIDSKSSSIRIPGALWRSLLEANRGGTVSVDVSVAGEGGGITAFEPFTNTVADEAIDGYVAYRLMKPWYTLFGHIGLYQRNLEDFTETLILDNRDNEQSCINCHSFANYATDPMTVHVRFPFVMLVVDHGEVRRIDTRTDFNKAPFAYPAWHPGGRIGTYSVNKILQVFHAAGETRDAFDLSSDLVCYDLDRNTVFATPAIADPARLETFPAWSPDGRHLYFSSAPALPDQAFAEYLRIQYDLVRVSFDVETGKWGGAETVLAAADLGKSITAPRVSPDGRFVLFCGSDHGSFPIFQEGSDLYLLDLETGHAGPLECNSDVTDAWHAWSSNGRWIVFSSKRLDKVFTRLFISYVDEDGHAHKPFLLPQEDPEFYDGYLKLYNLPEFVKEPVRIRPRTLAEAILSKAEPRIAQLDPAVRSMLGLQGGPASAEPDVSLWEVVEEDWSQPEQQE